MQALSYITLGWQFEAEMIITPVKTSLCLMRALNFVRYVVEELDAARAKAA